MNRVDSQAKAARKGRVSTHLRAVWVMSALMCISGPATACARLRRAARGEGTQRNAADAQGEIQVNGLTRTYLFHLPRGYRSTQPTPLLFALHGGGGRGRGMSRLTSLDAVADRENFIVVYPDGIEKHWNDGRPTVKSKTDDVGFISGLIDKFGRDYNIDQKRIYAAGISNGGMMAQRLACELSDKLAAIASDASSMPEAIRRECQPSGPVSVLVIDGTADPIVPYSGGTVKSFGGSGYGGAVLGAEATVKFWADRDGCSNRVFSEDLPDRDTSDGTRVKMSEYRACRGSSGAALYSIEGGGHAWPGGWQYLPQAIIGKTNRDIDASQVIWDFFKQHAKN